MWYGIQVAVGWWPIAKVAPRLYLPDITCDNAERNCMNTSVLLDMHPLDFQWPTLDPFLFCVHHDDAYPRGNAEMGPITSLAGRDLGQDFTVRDGWRMYHGTRVPGFPAHPHRGFETVTVVLTGFVDHSDSFGAAGRYGGGDVQWMTAGRGMQHAEMFPLLREDADNPLELFQIWLNLPRHGKLVDPHYRMFWSENIPVVPAPGASGTVRVRLIAGRLGDTDAPAPPPDSWAADADHAVAIWIIAMDAGSIWTLPAAAASSRRMLYFFEGAALTVGGSELPPSHAAELRSDQAIELRAGAEPVRALLLQGSPIAEPVVQYGPFVMNTQEEIKAAFVDYQRNQFGGWPWDRPDPVHMRGAGRFARYIDGTEERPRHG
jgi:redox-sensitive bicupin YhaK (pirin superfamily)